MKILFSFALFIITGTILSQGTFRPVNYQGAGWVTAVKYSTDASKIYARTDVGGAFRSDNGGASWNFISTFATSPGGLMTQGIAIKPNDPNTVLLCCGTSYLDSDPGKGIWKSTDGGNSWSHVQQSINFSGNDDIRWGGECIVYDPSNSNTLYAGGRESGLYKSVDAGNTWTQIAPVTTISGEISTISFRNGNSQEIWVGSETGTTPAGVWQSTNGGTSWTQMRTAAQIEDAVFRIIVKSDGTALVAYNDKLVKYSSGTWTNYNDFTTGQGNFCALHFMGNENTIVAGRMDYTRLSTDGGQTFPTVLNLNIIPPAPKHSYYWTYISWGRNEFMQNPVNANEWYMSGGFGCYKSSNAGQGWFIATSGINIPVMYRTHFHAINPNLVYTCMGDLTFARITDGGASGEITDYPLLYQYGVQDNITNGSVVFTTPANPNIIYCGGANDYSANQPGLFVSTNSGANFTRLIPNGIPNNTPDRPVLDGTASNTNANMINVFIGGNYDPNLGSDQGVFWSSDGGANFSRATGLSNNIFAPNIYFTSYMLDKDPVNTNKRYGYFGGDGGGFYTSNDEGRTWSLTNQVVSGYKNPGTLCIHPTIANLFYIAVPYTGLYKTTDGGVTWNNMAGWVEAEQVDSRANLIVAFGMRTGDQYEKIYASSNSGNTWGEVTNAGHRLPNTSSLAINPYNNNQLWIGTAGNGVFIFEGLTIGIKRISTGVPDKFSLYQNYPNPFNPTTKIKFSLPFLSEGGVYDVKLFVYDLLGRKVASLIPSLRGGQEELVPGTYEMEFDGSKYSSGIYFYKLSAGDFTETRKMVLLK